jgi:hypothetical protein
MSKNLPDSKEVVKVIERRDTLIKKICEAPGCDNEFLGLKRQRFCSPKCRNRANYHKHGDEYRAAKTARYQASKEKKS